MNENREALVVFVKNSEPGTVKTRLARAVGNERALQIYERLLAHTAAVAGRSQRQVCTYYSDYIPSNDIWTHIADRKEVQSDGDLGDRMREAFTTQCFESDKVVLIGSDCGELNEEIVSGAFAALEHTDFVVGPSRDGGYYLIGMREATPELFSGIAWSSEAVFAKTIQHLLALGKNFAVLNELNDVDTIEDWNELGW